jgi:NAD-dependent SIR2 family protein deacetylase
MLIAGTSATVTPAAWFPEVVLRNGGTLIEVNVEATPLSAQCAASLRDAAGAVLPAIVAAVEALRA